MKRIALTIGLVVALGGCGAEGPDYGKSGGTTFGQAGLALKSSTGSTMLRIGQSLTLESLKVSDKLQPDTKYAVILSKNGVPVFEGSLLTDTQGRVPASTLAHDVGEFGDGMKNGDQIKVQLDDGISVIAGKIDIQERLAQGAGWAVDEVSTPHVFAAGPDGKPVNAFVVGGKEADEVSGPIHVAGDHFPPNTTVDVYVVKDRDVWRGAALPQQGEAGHIAGPIAVTTDANGNLPLTATTFSPSGSQHLGPYDIVVDVDRNGTYDWGLTHKDAADGENKVGFTIQYSQSWLKQLSSKHLIVNLAWDNKRRDQGTYRNSYSTGQVFGYVNPPVFKARKDYHTRGVYVLVEHQSWTKFWNNPDPKLDAGCPGCRRLSTFSVSSGGGGGDFVVPQQPGCMNGPPVALLNATSTALNQNGQQVRSFDLVFLANRKKGEDLIYIPGRDLLDLNIANTNAALLDPSKIDDNSAKGFSIQ